MPPPFCGGLAAPHLAPDETAPRGAVRCGLLFADDAYPAKAPAFAVRMLPDAAEHPTIFCGKAGSSDGEERFSAYAELSAVPAEGENLPVLLWIRVFFFFSCKDDADAHRRHSTTVRKAHDAEHIQIGTIMLKGSRLPAPRRSAMSVVGKRSRDAAPSAANVTISSEATPPVQAAFIFSIAESASGVAAFPIPRMLAESAAQTSSRPAPLCHVFGKTWRKTGESRRESTLIAPLSRSTSIIPFHRHIAPQSDITTVTAFAAPSSAAFATAPIFPVNAANTADRTTNEKNTFQSKFFLSY